MAEISEKNIIFSVDVKKNELLAETEKTAKAVTSLDKDLKKAGTDAEKAFSGAAKSVKEYNKLIADAEKKSSELSKEIKEQERITNDFQKRLSLVNQQLSSVGRNTVQFQRLTKEANLLKESIKDNNIALKGLKLEKAQVDETARSFGDLAKQSGSSKEKLEGLLDTANESLPAFGKLSGVLKSFGLVGKGLAVGVAAISAAFTFAKNNSQEFGQQVEVLTARFRGFTREYIKFAAEITADLFRGNSIDNFFERFRALRDSANTTGNLFASAERINQQANRERIDNLLVEAKLTSDIASLRLQIEERKKQGVTDDNLINQAIEKTNQLYNTQLEIQKKRVQSASRLLLSDKNDLQFKELAFTEAVKLQEIETERDNKLRELIALREREAEVTGIIAKLNEAITKETEKRNRANDPLQIIESERRLKALNDELQLYISLRERANDVQPLDVLSTLNPTEVRQRVLVVQEEIQKLREILAKLANEDSTYGIQIKGQINALKKELEGIDPLLKNIQQSLNATNTFSIGLSSDDALKEESIKNLEDEAQRFMVIAQQLTQDILAEETRRRDQQIEIARDRVAQFRALAEQGSAEQLQLEEERLAALIEARERAAQRERAIAAIQIAAANAVTVAKSISAIAQGFSGPGAIAQGIATTVALASAIAATILAVRNATSSIPAFKDGTEYVFGPGGGRDDKITAKLSRGERVVDAKKNKELGGISNSRLVEAVKFYDTHHKIKSHEFRGGSQFSDSNIVSEIRYMREEIRDLQMTMRVDEYGLSAGLERATRRRQRVKNLR